MMRLAACVPGAIRAFPSGSALISILGNASMAIGPSWALVFTSRSNPPAELKT